MSIEQRIAAIRSTALGSMSAYHVQPAQNVIKLDAMENPFHWPKALEAKWQESLAGIAMNRYPSAGAESLKEELRRVFSIDSAYPIVLGNGSDELILLLAQIVHQPGACIMGVDPSFVMYRQITHSLNLDYIGIALNDDFSIDLPKTLAAIEQHKPSLIFLAMPNNPTGNLFSDQDVQAIIEAAPGLVVLDEAYTAFTQYDSQKWLVEHQHVVIMRTVSKMGLAGLRLGFCFAHPAITNELEKVRLPYNINCLTQHTAEFILKHADILEAQTQALRELRSQLNDQLSLFSCFEVFPSEANFLLVRVLPSQLSAREIFTALKERGVLIKCLDGGHPLLAQCLRFTVGSEEENQALISALKDILK